VGKINSSKTRYGGARGRKNSLMVPGKKKEKRSLWYIHLEMMGKQLEGKAGSITKKETII